MPTSKKELAARVRGARESAGLTQQQVADVAERADISTQLDLMSLFEDDGVNVAAVALPDDVSGLAITKGSVAPFIAVNKSYPSVRLRFSLAHEFCHVLVDRALTGRISRASERDGLIEVRSNSFAAAFLMPEDGVRGACSRQTRSVCFVERRSVDWETDAWLPLQTSMCRRYGRVLSPSSRRMRPSRYWRRIDSGCRLPAQIT